MNGNGVLRLHSKEAASNMIEKEIILLKHADDDGVLFNDREILIKGIE